mgnify:CR=1 FL=1
MFRRIAGERRRADDFHDFPSMHNVLLFRPFWKICTDLHRISAYSGAFFSFSTSQIGLINFRDTFALTRFEHFRQDSTKLLLHQQKNVLFIYKTIPFFYCIVCRFFENCKKAVHYASVLYFTAFTAKNKDVLTVIFCWCDNPLAGFLPGCLNIPCISCQPPHAVL